MIDPGVTRMQGGQPCCHARPVPALVICAGVTGVCCWCGLASRSQGSLEGRQWGPCPCSNRPPQPAHLPLRSAAVTRAESGPDGEVGGAVGARGVVGEGLPVPGLRPAHRRGHGAPRDVAGGRARDGGRPPALAHGVLGAPAAPQARRATLLDGPATRGGERRVVSATRRSGGGAASAATGVCAAGLGVEGLGLAGRGLLRGAVAGGGRRLASRGRLRGDARDGVGGRCVEDEGARCRVGDRDRAGRGLGLPRAVPRLRGPRPRWWRRNRPRGHHRAPRAGPAEAPARTVCKMARGP